MCELVYRGVGASPQTRIVLFDHCVFFLDKVHIHFWSTKQVLKMFFFHWTKDVYFTEHKISQVKNVLSKNCMWSIFFILVQHSYVSKNGVRRRQRQIQRQWQIHLKNIFKEQSLRFLAFETFDQSDENTWPDQQKDNNKDEDKYNDKNI